jgi:translation initiation factor 2 beta subunit (eIF-2beta)/eIF-5
MKNLHKVQYGYTICNDCGKKYGRYVVGCSSIWMDTCDYCGEYKPITEARDWNYPPLPEKE